MIFAASLRLKKCLPPLALALLCSTDVQAEKWYFEPTIDLRIGYDDNVRLRTDPEDSAFSAYIKADARFGFRTEVSDVKFGVVLDSRQYQGQGTSDDLDTNDQFFSLDGAYRAGLNLFRLEADFKRDSTRTSEELTTGLFDTIRRNSLLLRPSWQHNLNERTQLQFGYSYTDVEYDERGRRRLVDYRYDVADFGVIYNLTEKTNFQTTFGVAMYEADNIFSESKSYWVQFGLIHQFTERLSGSAVIGPRYTEFDFLEFDIQDPLGRKESSNDTGYILDLRIKREYETFSLEAGLSTGQNPSSSGRLLTTNDLEFKLRGKFSERLNYSISTRFNRNESARGSDSSQDRDYIVLEPRISWRASRWWTITGSYRYRWQEYTESDNGPAASNAIFISARYIWPRESLDRWMEL